MGVLGLGVDIVEIDRMAAALKRRPRIKERIFSEEERRYCDKRTRPEVHYALRFAAKEAVLKALAPPVEAEVPLVWRDIDIRRARDGRHDVVLHGPARALAERRGVTRILLSITLARGLALASAVLEAQA